MEQRFQNEISNLIVKLVHETYKKLPRNGKPIIRDDGRTEFTILAGIVLLNTANDNNKENEGKVHTICPSLAFSPRTGMRCLPQEKLTLQGDLLHDSHAEVLVRRGFRLWLYDEVRRSCEIGSRWVNRSSGYKDQFSLKESVQVFFYVSTLPCGDASMLLTSQQVTDQSRPSKGLEEFTTTASEFSTEYQKSISASLGTLHVARGRLGFDQPAGTLRTKPGRIDSPPSTSHSCSDKLALWNVVGLQGALGSSIFQPIRVSGYVFGTCDFSPQLDLQALHSSLRYALIDRVKAYLPADHCSPGIWFTSQEFEFSQKSVARAANTSLELHDRVVSTVNCELSTESRLSSQHPKKLISGLHFTCAGLSLVSGYGVEVIDRHGSRQGAPKKRRAPEAPLLLKTRSRLSKLELYRRHSDTLILLGLGADHLTKSYHEAKHPQISEIEHNSAGVLAQRVFEYQIRKSSLRDLPKAAFYGWIVHGARWENFDIEGHIMPHEAEK